MTKNVREALRWFFPHFFINSIWFQWEEFSKAENEKLQENPPAVPDDLFYMKQCIHNACGTIALVHGIANNYEWVSFVSKFRRQFTSNRFHSIELDDDSILKKYLDAAKTLSAEERGKLLEGDSTFTSAHQELAQEGQTDANSGDEVNHHFIAYINHNGNLYELDGRKAFPINHGPTTAATLLQVCIACGITIAMNSFVLFLGCCQDLQGHHGSWSRRTPF